MFMLWTFIDLFILEHAIDFVCLQLVGNGIEHGKTDNELFT